MRLNAVPRPSVVVALCAALFAALTTSAPALAAKERVRLQIRVIEAAPGPGPQQVDPRLNALAKDLRSLPFVRYDLKDAHEKVMAPAERVSFEFPGRSGERRFLVVTSHGEQTGGKLRFQLTIAELKFDTLVAVPDGGTILVGGPKHGGKTVFFAVTAKKAIAAHRPVRR